MKISDFSDDDIKIIKDLKGNGMSQREIGEKFNCDKGTIQRLYRRMGWLESKKKKEKTTLPKSIPIELHQEIINLYNTHEYTMEHLAKIYNSSKATIGKLLAYYDVDTLSNVRKSQFNSNDVKNMAHLYFDEEMTYKQIAFKYGVDESEIGLLLRKAGFQSRQAESYHPPYLCDENYFDSIDNQNKAYFFGLLYSDGCNGDISRRIELGLQESDKHILESFSKELKTEKPLYFRELSSENPNHKNQWVLQIGSKHMREVLESYGMVPRKSLVKNFPKGISDELLPHFLRGYFDGNGCIAHNLKSYDINIVSTIYFLEIVKEKLKNIGIDSKIFNQFYETHPIKSMRFNKENGKKFLDYIYKDANYYLYRKYNLYYQKYIINYN